MYAMTPAQTVTWALCQLGTPRDYACHVAAGATATFQVSAGGSQPLAYQWRTNTVPVVAGTNAILIITNVQLAQSGTLFSVTVSNVAGLTTSTNALLSVLPASNGAPFIIAQPTNRTVTAGANVSFTVIAGGATPLRFQWRFNGNNIGGLTTNFLSLTNVQAANAGNYSALVSNSFGTVLSSNAVLTVSRVFMKNGPPLVG